MEKKHVVAFGNADKPDKYILVKAILIPANYINAEDERDVLKTRRQYTRSELESLDMRGLVVKYEHQGSLAIGHVIDSDFSSDGSYQVLIEIPPYSGTDRQTLLKSEARRNLVGLLVSSALTDVSLHHKASVFKEGRNTRVVREMLDVSFVSKGGRVGSHVLKVMWTDASSANVIRVRESGFATGLYIFLYLFFSFFCSSSFFAHLFFCFLFFFNKVKNPSRKNRIYTCGARLFFHI